MLNLKSLVSKLKLPPSSPICFKNRTFTLFQEGDLEWTKHPVLATERKRKFAPAADYDSESESIVKESKKMLQDLRLEIARFEKGDPLTRVTNLTKFFKPEPQPDSESASTAEDNAHSERRAKQVTFRIQ